MNDRDAAKANKALVRCFFAVFTDCDPSRLEDLLADDYRDHGHDPVGIGVQGARDDYDLLTATFDHIRYELHDLVAEGDRVAVRWTASMTHVGPFENMPPTGRRVTLQGFSIYEVKAGRIAATWNLQDVARVRDQIAKAEEQRR